MAELLRRGYVAALAPDGVPNMDIVVTSQNGSRQFALQVKARLAKGRDGGWHMKAKHESIVSPTLFYVFVDFGVSPDDRPAIFILPSAKVSSVLKESYDAWLTTPGKNGRARQPTVMRRFVPSYEYARKPASTPYPKGWLDPYRDAWHLLEEGGFDLAATI